MDRIPLLVNGKTDRQALLKRHEEQNTSNEGEQTPNTLPFRPFLFTYKTEYDYCTTSCLMKMYHMRMLFNMKWEHRITISDNLERSREETLIAHVMVLSQNLFGGMDKPICQA